MTVSVNKRAPPCIIICIVVAVLGMSASASTGGATNVATTRLGLDNILMPRSRSLLPAAVAWRSSSVATLLQ
jgi:hypothetical protein